MYFLSIEIQLNIIVYNSQLEYTLKSFKLFTSPGVLIWNLFMNNNKTVVFHTTKLCFINCNLINIFLVVSKVKYFNDYLIVFSF